jgi:hypothetical protein
MASTGRMGRSWESPRAFGKIDGQRDAARLLPEPAASKLGSGLATSEDVLPDHRVYTLRFHVRHGLEAVDHDVALGLVDPHGHIKAAIVKFFIENF